MLEGPSPNKRNSIVGFNSPPKKNPKSVVAPIKNVVDVSKKKPQAGKSKKGSYAGTQSRMIIINSPLMQPPPEIKQTKVIINLFSKYTVVAINCRSRDRISTHREGGQGGAQLASIEK